MDQLPKPEIIVTHDGDLDGLLSGMLLQKLSGTLFGEEIRLLGYQTHAWHSRCLRENSAWVSDLAFEERMDRINWVIIDHHITSVKPTKARLVHDESKSACMLAYGLCKDHGLQSDALDRLVHLANVGDLFLRDDPDFEIANDYGSLVKTYGFWNVYSVVDGDPEKLLDHPLLEVMRVKREVEDPMGLKWSRKNIQEITPEVGLVKTVVGNSNVILNHLLREESQPYKVLIMLNRIGNNQFMVSLRSSNGEALRMAKQLQGGGHANASGAALPKSVQRVADAVDYLKTALNPITHSQEILPDNLEALFDSAKI
ncbi:MAG: phosphoesterase [Verrucomicrobiales bacterium]|nr:phosphoesterase [Verrucomicrobiales bacterium]MEC7882153.1 DHH family phosphoesterase [Verrucomicrobiota bacterium]|tara:strand:- start:1366 stop:2304 length:939 start_codon:yes stop_codon:yes gene_type:complete